MRVLLFFIDGVGIGPRRPTNPFTAARLPALRSLLDGRRPVAGAAPYHGTRASLVGIDATHGYPGTPQSGTGHTTLLTGEDAVTRFGRHYGPWVPTSLRALVAGRSVLARVREAGGRVAFANAYPEELVERVPVGLPISEAVRSRAPKELRPGRHEG